MKVGFPLRASADEGSYYQGLEALGASMLSVGFRTSRNTTVDEKKLLHYPQQGIYQNSHSLGSLRSCRIYIINSMMFADP